MYSYLVHKNVSSLHNEMYCHDLEVMSSNPGCVELGVRNTFVLSRTWTKDILCLLNPSWVVSIYILVSILNPMSRGVV